MLLGLSLSISDGAAQVAVPRHLSVPRGKQIWSRNKRFVADVFLDQGVTRIGKVDWQGNIGRTTPLWSMEGTFSSGWLSDDGAHLVTALESPISLPEGYNKDHVLLSFCCGYLAVETIEDKKLLLDVATGETVRFGVEKAYQVQGWNSYQNGSRCYQFQFPREYSLRENLTPRGTPAGWLWLKGAEDKDWLIDASVEDMADYPREFAGMDFEEFALDRTRAMYSADGCDSSTYVSGVARKQKFVNRNRLDVIEFFLVVAHETSEEDGKTTIEKETVGPVYAVSIGAPQAPARILFLRPANGAEKEFSQINPPLRTIVDTVVRFPVVP